MLKPRLSLPLEENPNVGIGMDVMVFNMLGKLTIGKEVTVSVPQIEGPIEKGMDGVVPMVLREGKVDVTSIPLVPLEYGLDGLATLEETLGLDMVGGFLNKEKG
jgi:hypothetical protein